MHHMIGLLGIVSALAIGRIVGVIAVSIMATELSTIFLNFMFLLKLRKLQDIYYRFNQINSFLLVFTFFLSRIVYLGILLVMYIIPVLIDYDYEKAAQEVGWFKIRWA